jgi:hypothetical protein
VGASLAKSLELHTALIAFETESTLFGIVIVTGILAAFMLSVILTCSGALADAFMLTVLPICSGVAFIVVTFIVTFIVVLIFILTVTTIVTCAAFSLAAIILLRTF